MGINLTNTALVNGYKLDKYGLSMGINLSNMTPINEYKLDKSGHGQWVIVVDKMALVNGLE